MALCWKTIGIGPVYGVWIALLAILLCAGCGVDSESRQTRESTASKLTASDAGVIPAEPMNIAPQDLPMNKPLTAESIPPEMQAAESAAQGASSSSLASLARTISQSYESAKSQGLTAATNARDWLFDDLNSSNRWEYKIITAAEGNPTQLERALNELGRDGWQCFHVHAQSGSLQLFLQRHPSSISRSISMSDLLKVLPYLGLGSGDR